MLSATAVVGVRAQDVGVVHDDPAGRRKPIDSGTIGVLLPNDPEEDAARGLSATLPEVVVHRAILPSFAGIRVLKARSIPPHPPFSRS